VIVHGNVLQVAQEASGWIRFTLTTISHLQINGDVLSVEVILGDATVPVDYAVIIHSILQRHCMQLYLMLRSGNFYAKKQDGNKVLPLGARWSRNYAPQCTDVKTGASSSST